MFRNAKVRAEHSYVCWLSQYITLARLSASDDGSRSTLREKIRGSLEFVSDSLI